MEIRFLIYLSSVILFFSQDLCAQGYDKLLDNTSWKGAWQIHNGPTNQFWYHTVGDTVINLKNYVIIEHTETFWGFISNNPKKRYLREDTIIKKVWLLDTNMATEKLLYDFGLNLGDTIVPAWQVHFTNPVYQTLRRIDTTLTPWGMKRRLHFDSINYINGYVLVEGVGWTLLNYGQNIYLSDDLGAFDLTTSPWAYHHFWTACIYKNRIQVWENLWSTNYTTCESMCPSLGNNDTLLISEKKICPGDSTLLTGPCDTSVYWTTLDSPTVILGWSDSLWVKPLVSKAYLWHGTLKTDTIHIDVGSPFSIELGPDTSICEGQSIVISPSTLEENVHYYWFNKQTSSSINVNKAGSYWVVVWDEAICFSASDTINITIDSLPNVGIDSFKVYRISDPPDTLSSGRPQGGKYSGNVVVNGIFYPAQAGIGTHQITYSYTDSNYCTNDAVMIVEVTDISSINTKFSEKVFTVYPNPSIGNLNITANKEGQIRIINSLGEQIYSQEVSGDRFELNLTLVKGFYLIYYRNSDIEISRKVIIN